MINIVLADDHKIVRQGIKLLLDLVPDMCVVAEADDGVQAVKCCDELHPDVLIVDLSMPGLSGIGVMKEVVTHLPGTKIVVLTIHDTVQYVAEALDAGALGYVIKDSTLDQLANAIREAAAGRRFLSPPLSSQAVEEYRSKSAVAGQSSPALEPG